MKSTFLGFVWIFSVGTGALCAQRAPERHLVSTAAVSATLAAQGLAITPEMVTLPAAITSSVSDPALGVASIEASGNQALRVRVLCKAASECLPFLATASLPDHTSMTQAVQHWRGTQTAGPEGHPSTQHVSQSDLAVHAGSGATLLIDQDRLHIRLPVVCLQNGAVGQMIEVAANGDRKHTLHVSVLDIGLVRGRL